MEAGCCLIREGGLTRLVLVDDDLYVRSQLSGLLDAYHGIVVIGVFSNGADAVEAIAGDPPDVALVNVNMPDMDGIETTRRILDVAPEVRVLGLTSQTCEQEAASVMAAGAVGVLTKDTPPVALCHAICAARDGLVVLSPSAARLVQAVATPVELADVSDIERAILHLVCDGESNPGIATLLFLSPSTVKHRVSSLMGRLGVANRVKLALAARESGLA